MKAVLSSPRRRRFLWSAVILLVVVPVAGFFVAPPIIKKQLEKRASEALGRTVTVGKVRVNPYAVSLTLENFDVRLKDGSGSFVGWDRLYVNFDPLASVLGTWTFGAIELDGFHATARLQKDRKFNFHDIIERLKGMTAPPGEKGKERSLPAVHVGLLKVTGARLDFEDQSRIRPFSTSFGPVSLAVSEFRSTGKRGAPYHFEAVTESGEKFDWSGTVSADPLGSSGTVAVENISLPKHLAYYGDRLMGEVREGRLNFRGKYTIDLAEGARVLKLSGGDLQLRGVKIAAAPESELAAELPSVDVTGIEADALAMKAVVAAVSVKGGRVQAVREADGSINLLTMLEPSAAALAAQAAATPAPEPTTPAPAPAVPDVLVRDIAVQEFQVDVIDRAAPRPAQLSLSGLQVSLKDATLAEGAVIPITAGFSWAPQGTVKVEGTVALKPTLKADLKTDVAAFALLPLSPYLEQFLNARITEGTVTTAGAAQAAWSGEVPAITYAGTVTVDKLGLVDGARNEELAGFASLALTELKAETSPRLAVSLAEVNVTGPYARVVVGPDRSINLLSVLKRDDAEKVGGASRPDSADPAEQSGHKAPPSSEAPAAPTQPAALPDIKIGRVVISGGEFSLQDQSFEPHVRTKIGSFGGTIGSLSSDNPTRAEINLTATVDGAAPVTIAGKLDPFGAKRFIDLVFDAKGVELLPFSPYSGRYAGFELARGKLDSNLKLKLDGKQLDATNVIVLNGFTFGGPVESPDATKLPVRLGVALLKDSAGQIVIDVPVSGNIDDPEVRLRKAIMRVIGNLLAKAATSPFSLLGSLLGGGGEELAFQEFAPGRSVLESAQLPKLETLAKMLTSRPGLSVGIEGAYDGPADTYALQRLKLADQVRRTIWEERHAIDPNIAPPDQLQVTPEENIAMVTKLYDAKFPPGTEFGAPLPEKPAVTAPPQTPPEKKSFLQRVIAVLSGGAAGETNERDKELNTLKENYQEAKEVAAATGRPLEEMVGRLAEAVAVTDNDLQALAADRAKTVRDYLLNEGKIAADRLFLSQGTVKQAAESKGPRVFLSLQ